MEGDALRGLGTDAGQLAQLVDEPRQRGRVLHRGSLPRPRGVARARLLQNRPGIFGIPPAIPPSFSCRASSTLRDASLTAAVSRSWSISTSSLLTTSGSI